MENYESFVERMIELHTFASLPSVLLIDDFDAYINDYKDNEISQDLHKARLCSLILDTMNSCARILKIDVSNDIIWSMKNKIYLCLYIFILLFYIQKNTKKNLFKKKKKFIFICFRYTYVPGLFPEWMIFVHIQYTLLIFGMWRMKKKVIPYFYKNICRKLLQNNTHRIDIANSKMEREC